MQESALGPDPCGTIRMTEREEVSRGVGNAWVKISKGWAE